ncbi:histone-lysine N-methyltransferase setd3-like isoform X1 [Copidosoma floridanum]|uniref:histone-lysine N-methyltransferase setd3-like isoform X1 n=1 Tax=Copidosoma floridanum TaxID=29053 RepID=UPI0006C9B816|nr:histone-lysine N-methyltransferase setd3-like isoform X1 [Copidosoma floridanum]XP_014216630.1 histone-lysine N-methyltransferase setd3-like isoform X1 [Copidosoma floridanum]
MGKNKSEFHRKNRNDTVNRNTLKKRKEINAECEKLLRLSSHPSYLNNLWENYLEISSCLENIRKLESVRIDAVERFDATNDFLIWLKENGAKIDNISIHKFPDYDLGLKAEKDFEENDLLLEIPKQLIFSVYRAAPELKDIQNDVMIQHMPQVALAISLLIEKKREDSKWKPYLNILPKKYCTVLYMNVKDMMELKGSPSFEPALKQCRNIARQYSYFHKLFHNNESSVSKLLGDDFTYEDYRWAVSTVMTRQNIIPSEDGSQMIHSLIPMWDMCNHQEGRITTNFNEASNSCECHAMRDFKSGEQIFIYYGPRTNTEFFVHSGFVHPGNQNDDFVLRLGVSKADALGNERAELLTKINLLPISDYSLKPDQGLISGPLLGFLRIFNMTKEELHHWLQSDAVHDITKVNCEIEKSLDEKAIKFLKTRIIILLTQYPKTQEDCDKLLHSTQDPCRKLVYQMKILERNILNRILLGFEKPTKV